MDDNRVNPLQFRILVTGGLLSLMVLVLAGMGRPFTCTCGTIKIWQGTIFSSQVSQHVSDWYTFTHITHGVLLYGVLCWIKPDLPFDVKLFAAIFVECGWEILENTDYVIEYYRQNTMAVHFSGDTILNSSTDVIAMLLGFGFASRSKVGLSVITVIVIEMVLIYFTRDSFFLNILMLLYPIEAIEAWQLAPVN